MKTKKTGSLQYASWTKHEVIVHHFWSMYDQQERCPDLYK